MPTPNPVNSVAKPGAKVLIVEDDLVTRHYLARTLEGHGHMVQEAPTGQDGLTMASKVPPDIVLLDLGLPDIEGTEVIRRLRDWYYGPIVILSLRGQEQDKVSALDAGADDYLTKPFGVPELMARMRVALRHQAAVSAESSPVFSLDNLSVDFHRRKVSVGEKEIHLTPIEYNLLAVLARQAGRVVTHGQLLKEVWGPQYSKETNYLRLYVKQLRDKIEPNPSTPRFLITEAGVGYRMADE